MKKIRTTILTVLTLTFILSTINAQAIAISKEEIQNLKFNPFASMRDGMTILKPFMNIKIANIRFWSENKAHWIDDYISGENVEHKAVATLANPQKYLDKYKDHENKTFISKLNEKDGVAYLYTPHEYMEFKQTITHKEGSSPHITIEALSYMSAVLPDAMKKAFEKLQSRRPDEKLCTLTIEEQEANKYHIIYSCELSEKNLKKRLDEAEKYGF